jgi:hypothetical protein
MISHALHCIARSRLPNNGAAQSVAAARHLRRVLFSPAFPHTEIIGFIKVCFAHFAANDPRVIPQLMVKVSFTGALFVMPSRIRAARRRVLRSA